jgi:hypothetical protein
MTTPRGDALSHQRFSRLADHDIAALQIRPRFGFDDPAFSGALLWQFRTSAAKNRSAQKCMGAMSTAPRNKTPASLHSPITSAILPEMNENLNLQ